ncbi:MAG: TRAP transporter substrate-binding protein DctP, partial [Hoeflea sp.]|nr:TRAP transporter substrate-binding protein DctP [Hoeflea sp.]
WGEVYSALQLGALDAAEAQPTAITGAKLFEVVKNVTKTGHIQLVTALVVSAEAWDKIAPENQKLVRHLAVDSGRYASDLTIKLGAESLDKVAASGVAVSDVDLAPFKDAVKGVYATLNLETEARIVDQVLGR